MSQDQEAAQVAVNANVLSQVHDHLVKAYKLIQTQPPAGPLMSVQLSIMQGEAVLRCALSQLKVESQATGLIVPKGSIIG